MWIQKAPTKQRLDVQGYTRGNAAWRVIWRNIREVWGNANYPPLDCYANPKGRICLLYKWADITFWLFGAVRKSASLSTYSSSRNIYGRFISGRHRIKPIWVMWWCFIIIIRCLGYVRAYLPLHKVADTPFHILGDWSSTCPGFVTLLP